MSRFTTEELNIAFSKKGAVSLESGDVNININAEAETGDEAGADGIPAVDPVVDTPAEVDIVSEDTSAVPETAELDVQETGGDVEDSIAEAEELDDTVDGLEAHMVELLNISNEGLEFGEAAVRMLHLSTNQLVNRFGLTAERIGVSSVEDFQIFGAESSLEASMEAVGESIKAAISQLIEMLKNIWANIVNFVRSIFNQVSATRHKTIALAKKLRAVGKTKDGEVNVPANLDGKSFNPAKVNNLVDLGNKVLSVKNSNLAAVAGKENVTVADIDAAVKASYKGMAGQYSRGSLPGGLAVSGEDVITIERQDGPTAGKIKTPDVGACNAMLKQASDLMGVASRYEKNKSAHKSVNDALVSVIKKTASADAKSAYKDAEGAKGKAVAAGGVLTARRKAVRQWNRIVAVEVKLVTALVATANSLNNLVAASIGGKEAPAADKE